MQRNRCFPRLGSNVKTVSAMISFWKLRREQLNRMQRLMNVTDKMKNPAQGDCPFRIWRFALNDAQVFAKSRNDVLPIRWMCPDPKLAGWFNRIIYEVPFLPTLRCAANIIRPACREHK